MNRRIGLTDNPPIANGREFRAMVTIEEVERLASRALAALDDETMAEGVAIDHVHLLLNELVDATSSRTASEVKGQKDSDDISADAAKGIGRIVENFLPEHRAIAESYSRDTGGYEQ